MGTPALKHEFDYYKAHQVELVTAFRGKYVVIKGDAVLGAYSSELEAIRDVGKTHELGTFLVQKAEPGDMNYTQSFHSRVSFA